MVDEESFQPGGNRVEFYIVEGRTDRPRLRPVAATVRGGASAE